MKKMSTLGRIAFILVVVGGLNWGLVGLFDFDLVATIFGKMSPLSKIIYVLIGLSTINVIFAGINKSKMGQMEQM